MRINKVIDMIDMMDTNMIIQTHNSDEIVM